MPSQPKQRNYLDLTALQAGDVLLTSERTFISRAIVFAQRFLHFNFLGPGYSHATVVISPCLTFDTRGGPGARFRRLVATEISESSSGKLQLWLDVSSYKNFLVVRPANRIDASVLLLAAAEENTAPYPGLMAFFGLLHPAIKAFWNRVIRRGRPSSENPPKKFCSSLVAYLLQQVEAGAYLHETDWSAVSPFKLQKLLERAESLVVARTPESFVMQPVHHMLLLHAQASAGANSSTDMDWFQHASEDLIRSAVESSLLRPSLENDPDYRIQLNGKDISLLDNPHLAQLPFLMRQIRSDAELVDRFRAMETCFAQCQEGCANAAGCYRDVCEQMRNIERKESSGNDGTCLTSR